MAIGRDNKGSNVPRAPLELIEAGVHPMRLCRVYDLGVQEDEYKGEKKMAAEIMVSFELLDTFMKDEDGNDDETKPRMMSRRLKLFKGSTKSREVIWARALDPQDAYKGDWGAMAKARLPVLGSVTHNKKGDKLYVNLDTLSGVPKNFPLPDGKVEVLVYDLDQPDLEVFDKLPDFIKEIIEKRVDPNRSPVMYTPTVAAPVAAEVASDEGDQPW